MLDSFAADVRTPGYNFTAYVLWDAFLNNIEQIQLAELYGDEHGSLIEIVREKIVEHFHAREVERRAELIKQWKASGDYPYSGEPKGEAERAEREVFDFVATTVAGKIPKSRVARKTTLGFLREVAASEPSSLPRVLDDLFSLKRSQQEDFERLLDRTTLSKLIAANTVIANRLDFIVALREMVFDPQVKTRVKERSELHKILERETWVFGEDYGLLLSDKGLEQVLDRHIEKLRPGEKRRHKTQVRRSDGSRGIVDLMLAQQRVGATITENLVVELKRPAVVITNKEAGQIKSYADAVSKDPQFLDRNVRWDFWIISTKMDDVVAKDAQANNRMPGLIADWENIVRIFAKTWSQLIGDRERRLRHYKQVLDHDASSEHAAEYLNRAHDPDHVPAPFKAGRPAAS